MTKEKSVSHDPGNGRATEQDPKFRDLQEVLEIIRNAHSDNPVDPRADAKIVEARLMRVNHKLEDYVFEASWMPEADLEWQPERCDLLDGEVEHERLDELRKGAPLTPEERELFEARADAASWCGTALNIIRVSVPPETGERRCVFFVLLLLLGAPWPEINECGGPFASIPAACEFIADKEAVYWRDPVSYWTPSNLSDFPERAELEKGLDDLKRMLS